MVLNRVQRSYWEYHLSKILNTGVLHFLVFYIFNKISMIKIVVIKFCVQNYMRQRCKSRQTQDIWINFLFQIAMGCSLGV